MQYVFIAVGGSGTKVAEALVRLLIVGMPTHRDENGLWTSSGDKLQIWRLDSDDTGAAEMLRSAVDNYKALQDQMGAVVGQEAGGQWSLTLDPKIRHLNPLYLTQGSPESPKRSLRAILDSDPDGPRTSKPILNAFYRDEELELPVDRGFYQKPFIGAPIAAVFAESLRKPGSPYANDVNLANLANQEVRFMLCGSLHGGTGACGVPVFAQYLGKLAETNKNWHVGACLLTPYQVPPHPPFGRIAPGQNISSEMVNDLLTRHSGHPAFAQLTQDSAKVELVSQILKGFYADPEDMQDRARQGLAYFCERISEKLARVYLVGKEAPDTLTVWSNGGPAQRNPSNSSEVTAALAALEFFSCASPKFSNEVSYFVGTASENSARKPKTSPVQLHDLPRYEARSGELIDPERVILATSVALHLLAYHIQWDIEAEGWSKGVPGGLKQAYRGQPNRQRDGQARFQKVVELVRRSLYQLCARSERDTFGWSGEDYNQANDYLSASSREKVAKKIDLGITRLFKSPEPLTLGQAGVMFKLDEFSKWFPPGPFSEGAYLRNVWARIYQIQATAESPMGADGARVWLNGGFLADHQAISKARCFLKVTGQGLSQDLKYQSKYFEALPTAWASAYGLKKTLDGPKVVGSALERIETRRWMSVFLLHYGGVVHLERYDRKAIEDLNPHLWNALAGSYPGTRDDDGKLNMEMGAVYILKAADGTVVGGVDSETVFFVSRNREDWLKSELMKPYLKDGDLSWELCERGQLKTQALRGSFCSLLRGYREIMPDGGPARTALDKFCNEVFARELGSHSPTPIKADEPERWPTLARQQVRNDPLDFLAKYPLQRENANGEKVYYLLDDMPLLEWMRDPIEPGLPSPMQFRFIDSHTVQIDFQGLPEGQRTVSFPRKEGKQDQAVELKLLFLEGAPSCAHKPESARIMHWHEVEIREPVGPFAVFQPGDIAVCLAPVRSDFLKHFPEVAGAADERVTVNQGLDWTFQLQFANEKNYKFRWRIEPEYDKVLPGLNLTLWPPRVCPEWKLYAAHGFGADRRKSGQWGLIDERGTLAQSLNAAKDYYVNILCPPAKPAKLYPEDTKLPAVANNRPTALVHFDASKNERGVLFLDCPSHQAGKEQADVSLDFGTSNTSLAYKMSSGGPMPLIFGLSPMMVWGTTPKDDELGIPPFQWGTERGFFSTILMDRIRVDNTTLVDLEKVHPSDLQPVHLFQTDIPSLHGKSTIGAKNELIDGILGRLFSDSWHVRPDLKWNVKNEEPFRALFLQLSLMYAYAELFFTRRALVSRHVITYPLAFSKKLGEGYIKEVELSIEKIRYWCLGRYDGGRLDKIDESTAIARSRQQSSEETLLDVFVDIGGGSTDFAVRNHGKYLVLDSIKVAGRAFFHFMDKNFEESVAGGKSFKEKLYRLLRSATPSREPQKEDIFGTAVPDLLKVSDSYSLQIGTIDGEGLRKREVAYLQENPKGASYQRYRSRLFFRHVLTYALLQTCAAAVSHQLRLSDDRVLQVKLILSGNGWGLLFFGNYKRSGEYLLKEARDMFHLLKKRLLQVADADAQRILETIRIESVLLLNQEDFSEAKTSVARGALTTADEAEPQEHLDLTPYTGVTFESLIVNDKHRISLRWFDRCGEDHVKDMLGEGSTLGDLRKINPEKPLGQNQPLHPLLSAFTALGNTNDPGNDFMPSNQWNNINTPILRRLLECVLEGHSPVGKLLEQLYSPDGIVLRLDELARLDGNFKESP